MQIRLKRILSTCLIFWLGHTAWSQIEVEPITWDVVGLDSNRPLTSGPELFPTGFRIRSAVNTTNVVVNFVWPDGNGSGWDFDPATPTLTCAPTLSRH